MLPHENHRAERAVGAVYHDPKTPEVIGQMIQKVINGEAITSGLLFLMLGQEIKDQGFSQQVAENWMIQFAHQLKCTRGNEGLSLRPQKDINGQG